VDKGRRGERGDGGWVLLVFVEGEGGGASWGCKLGVLNGVPDRLRIQASVFSALMV
jgi:hypothetical protein